MVNCGMLQGEHSAILSTFIRPPFAIKTFKLSIFKWPQKTGFTVFKTQTHKCNCHTTFVVIFSPGVSLVGGIILGNYRTEFSQILGFDSRSKTS